MDQVPALAAKIIQGIKDVSTIGIARAMNTINTRQKAQKQEPKGPNDEKNGIYTPEM